MRDMWSRGSDIPLALFGSQPALRNQATRRLSLFAGGQAKVTGVARALCLSYM